jgi:aminoglycoside 6'-N-acetyltransferase I
MQACDHAELQTFAQRLWPDEVNHDFQQEHVFVFERRGGTLAGFASFSVRPFVNGADAAPCPHIEGWYVEPDARGLGVGRALISAIENWCAEHGFAELTSDACLANTGSLLAHAAIGFEPTEQVQYFRKSLSPRR